MGSILMCLVMLSVGLHVNYSNSYQYKRDVESSTATEEDVSQNATVPWQGDLVFITDKSNQYKFIVKIGYAGKIYKMGVYFRPRYVVVPYMKLFYYDEFDIYVMTWFNEDFQNHKYMRKIVNVITYVDAGRSCDFDLVILEVDVPFLWNKNTWTVPFMEKSKPPPHTQCTIVNIVMGNITTVNARVIDWNKSNCSNELGFMYGCNIENFLCLEPDTPIEFDLVGSPVMCDDKLVGTIPRYYIDEIIVIQYLPIYMDWILSNSDFTVRCGSLSHLSVYSFSAAIPLCVCIKEMLLRKY